MKPTGKHPGRKAMIAAIKTGRIAFEAHLKTCRQCREVFEVLSRFPVAGRDRIAQPTPGALDRYAAVPLIDHRSIQSRRVTGRVSFDSWANRPAAQIRDVTVGLIRRICLKAGKLSLEIVAERRQDNWEFVARVYDKKAVSSEYVLRVGAKNLLPRSQGFYHWSSKGTPRTLRLLSQDLQVDFERLSWR
jgi:hypothetical protein